MTDNEIIKALECCKGGWCISKNCPLNEFEDDGCEHILAKYALNLINNLLNENENLAEQLCHLEIKCEWLEKENESQKAEIEELEMYKSLYYDLRAESLETIKAIKHYKAEAIKEFAERLCEDRVSNDPVVIAVKTELKMMERNCG